MIKPNSFFRTTLFKIIAAASASVVVTGVAVGVGVGVGITNIATERAKAAISDLGITPDTDTVSDIDAGTVAIDRKLNVVTLGDSVTAGYTSLTYADGSVTGGDNLSYADYVGSILKKQNRLGTFNALAKSGATSASALDELTRPASANIIKQADLVFLTIGANDILRAVKMLNIPYSAVAGVLGNPTGVSSPATEASNSPARDDLIGDDAATSVANASYIPQVLQGLTQVLGTPTQPGDPSKLFSVDKDQLDLSLTSALSSVLKIVSFVHELAPKAMIVFAQYQFPFNRLQTVDADGNLINITSFPDDSYKQLTFNGHTIGQDTLSGTYDWVMDNIRDKVTSYFKVVKWYNLQKAQDKAIDDLLLTSTFDDRDEAVAVFQKDLADIHPTEYSHAVLGQAIFNELLRAKLSMTISSDAFGSVLAKVRSAKTPATTQPISLLFQLVVGERGEASPQNRFAAGILQSFIADFSANPTGGLPAFLSTRSGAIFAGLQQVLASLGGTDTTAALTAVGNLLGAIDGFTLTRIFNIDANTGAVTLTPLGASLAKITSPSPDINLINPGTAIPTSLAGLLASGLGFTNLTAFMVGESAVAAVSPLAADITRETGVFLNSFAALSDSDKQAVLSDAKIPAATASAGGIVFFKAVRNYIDSRPVIETAAQMDETGWVPFTGASAAVTAIYKTLLTSVGAAFQRDTTFAPTATRLAALTSAERDTVAKALAGDSASGASLANVASGVSFLRRHFLAQDAPSFTNTTVAAADTALNLLVANLNVALAHANAVVKAMPGAVFIVPSTARSLTLKDLRRGGIPLIEAQSLFAVFPISVG